MAELLNNSRKRDAAVHDEETKTETTNPITRHLMHASQLLGYDVHVPEQQSPPQERPKPNTWFTPEDAQWLKQHGSSIPEDEHRS